MKITSDVFQAVSLRWPLALTGSRDKCALLWDLERGVAIRWDMISSKVICHLLSFVPHFISSGHKCVLMSENWSTPQMWGPCSWTTKYWWPQTSSRIFTSGTLSLLVTVPPLATPATRGSETPASDHSQVCHCLSNGSFVINCLWITPRSQWTGS